MLKTKLKKIVFPVPAAIERKFLKLEKSKVDVLREGLETKYFVGWRSPVNPGDKKHEADLANHLINRLTYDRTRIIPWINSVGGISKMKILEIGCGTGSSTVALAEQGAEVTGIDIEEDSIEIARLRCELYGVKADFKVANALELKTLVDLSSFDMLIFFAVLEHMTIDERLESLRLAWEGLKPGAFIVVIETPNRLWYHDSHTSLLPFYHWLPDKLAFYYSKNSPRASFNNLYSRFEDDKVLHFQRRGRGVSFHEFDLALKDSRKLNIVSCLSTFDLLGKWKFSLRDRKYIRFLKSVYPNLNEGFFFQNLNMIIKKD